MTPPLPLDLDSARAAPLYRQIVDQVIALIRRGELLPGYRLPPTRRLAEQLAAHRNTVVRAYDELCAQGHTTSVVGRGTFVAEPAPDYSRPEPPVRTPLPWASLLSRRSDAEVLRREDRLDDRPARPDTIDLRSLQPPLDLRPHEPLRRCIDHVLRDLGPEALGYSPRGGVPRLRELLCDELRRSGVPAAPEDVVITSGSQQALDILARVLLDPGDTLLLEDTTYSGAIRVFTTAGARLTAVPSDGEGPDLDTLDRLALRGPRAFYLIPNCRNPTGDSISLRRRRALIAWSHDAGVPLIEDDYDADLALDGQPAPTPLRALDTDVVHVGTFSKKLLPALRVGYLVCPPALRERVMTVKRDQDLGTSALLQHALAEFLDRGYLRAHLKRIVPEYRARRDALEAGLTAHLPPALRWRHAERGLFLWLDLPDSLPAEDVFAEARRHGVAVSPSLLHRVEEDSRGGIRLTFCSEPAKRLMEGARRLGEALRAVAARTPRTTRADPPRMDQI